VWIGIAPHRFASSTSRVANRRGRGISASLLIPSTSACGFRRIAKTSGVLEISVNLTSRVSGLAGDDFARPLKSLAAAIPRKAPAIFFFGFTTT